MLTFQYVARDPATGEKVHSTVEAENEQSASKLLRDQGLAPLEIKLKSGDSSGFIDKYLHRITTKDKVLFSRQLSTLINAGLPLVQSLHNVAGQTQNKKFQVLINKIIGDVESGMAFSASLAKYPSVFDPIFVNLVAAGEASGTLDSSLERLANQKEKDAEITSKVRGAMVYPAIVMLVMIGVVIFMVVKVVPSVQVVYEGIPGAELPLVTRLLVGVADFTINYWWIEVLVIGILIFVGGRWFRTIGGRRFIDRVKMKVPPIGGLFMKLYMARFARIGSTLVASGVPLIQMLEITGKAVNNLYVEDSITKAIEKVKGGKSLSGALKGDPNFLPLVPDMLQIGEQSGSMEQMLGKTADYYEKEVDEEIRTISTTIEPVLMIIMGAVALLVVTAVLLPIYGLVDKIQL